jgi:hypothetical protein
MLVTMYEAWVMLLDVSWLEMASGRKKSRTSAKEGRGEVGLLGNFFFCI